MKISELEKEYKVDFKEKRDIKVDTWLNRKGFKELAKAFRRVERNLKR